MNKQLRFAFPFLFIASASFAQAVQLGWTQKPSVPAEARHRVSGCMVGDKCYVGTGHYNANAVSEFNDWWEFDPSTNSWTQKANVPGVGRYGAFCFGGVDKAYLGMGKDSWNFFNDFYAYDPTTNIWTPKATFPGMARATGAVVYCKGNGYVGLGYGQAYPSDWWEYSIVNDAWTQKAPFPGGGRLTPLIFSLNDKCYVGSGSNNNDLWEYDPSNDTWTSKATYAGGFMNEVAGFAYMGKGYAGSGLDAAANDHKDFYSYDPVTNDWDTIDDFAGTARRYLLTMNNIAQTKVYAGLGTNGINMNDFWEFGPMTVGVKEIPGSKITAAVYPNPLTENSFLQISNPGNKQLSAQLTDVQGKAIRCMDIVNNKAGISKEGLAPGIYYYRVMENNTSVASGKFIVQ
jgi:N-acetylneuraminic acid mutarotase